MIPPPAVLDDLMCHRAFTYNASHQDCEDVILEAYRQGAKDALALVARECEMDASEQVTLDELREAVDEDD